MKKKISITIDEKLLSQVDALIDYIYVKNRSNAIEFLVRKWLGVRRVAVVLSGGFADLLRVGKNAYRPTVKIKEKALIEHTLLKLNEENFNTVYIVGMKPLLDSISSIVDDGLRYGVRIKYVEETQPKGTAASLKLVKRYMNTPFLVVYGDIFINHTSPSELWETHLKGNFLATLFLTTSPSPGRKGIVGLEGSRVLSFNQSAGVADVYISFSSMFVAEPSLLDIRGEWLEREVFPMLASKGLLGGHVSSSKDYHIHSLKELAALNKLLPQDF